MKRHYKPQLRVFHCDECGTAVVAPKRKGRKTAVGHVKHMWCYVCQRRTRHTQTGE